ncbi:protocadherin beta-15 isoform X1 [Octopus bimaculoides]|nr:protocadherin beta-15 isoform X1 [Octopus bimaculoides]XP_052828995.1 protocadherin beta-15 isoform X1 [Octopus bimaculoides]XP_052828996.1 protocadherin beta-15 isoform X1 [Octopus bimaculoides]XP_052828997.1 protocadherin beta-15 isoform X1 [Octopus bimaculoides]XP_052828998.1 protocadherin beta-15 isoform X1 [Octopus bimaculoides]
MLVPVYILLSFLHCCLCVVHLVYTVQEGKSPGTYVGNIAEDVSSLDVSLQNQDSITFSLIKAQDGRQLFNVSKSGTLTTEQILDAEALCTYNIECCRWVEVAIKQDTIFLIILKIKVIVEDVNDHFPEFPTKEFKLEFYETDGKGTRRSVPNAIDKDVSIRNSHITYQLKNNTGKPFTLSVSKRVDGTDKLKIILEKKIDREVKDKYMLQILANDGGYPPKQCILDVEISVIDVNDNPPIFAQKDYNISIKNTHLKDTPVVILSAKDLDFGNNGQVSYHFSSKTSDLVKKHFRLTEETGEIFLQKKFPFGQKQIYKLFIEARDGGSPPLSCITAVNVNVINQQNNAPKIDINFVSALSESTATISEGIKTGSFIAYVKVTDNDLGQNGKVKCDLSHEKFKLESLDLEGYKITIKDAVDRETEDHYEITLSCQDEGSPSLKTERNFSIQVLDMNDMRPQFTKDTFKFLTYENEEPNFPVGFINATDPDLKAGGQLTYSLVKNIKTVLPFQITDNGFISTTQSLDREQLEIYEFQVLVKDNGIPSLNNTGNVIVEVMDENDNAPYFTFPSVNPFSLDVYYYPQTKNDITVLKAADRDSPRNAFLQYEIIGGNDKQLFSIDPYTGVLSFSRAVYQSDAGSYKLKFLVKDSGTPVLSATTTISLTLAVSNKTTISTKTMRMKSNKMIDVNMVIIIVVVTVIVCVAIVISITMCVVRYNNMRNGSLTAEVNPSIHSKIEKSHLISHSKNPATLLRNSHEKKNRHTQLIKSSSQFYFVLEPQNEWITSTTSRSLPTSIQTKSYAAIPRNRNQKRHTDSHLMKSASQFYFVLEPQNEWIASTTSRSLPQTRNSAAITRNLNERRNTESQLIDSSSQFYFVLEPQNEWIASTTPVEFQRAAPNRHSATLARNLNERRNTESQLIDSSSQFYFVLEPQNEWKASTTAIKPPMTSQSLNCGHAGAPPSRVLVDHIDPSAYFSQNASKYIRPCYGDVLGHPCTSPVNYSSADIFGNPLMADASSQFYFVLEPQNEWKASTTTFKPPPPKPTNTPAAITESSSNQFYFVLEPQNEWKASTTAIKLPETNDSQLTESTSQFYFVLEPQNKWIASSTSRSLPMQQTNNPFAFIRNPAEKRYSHLRKSASLFYFVVEPPNEWKASTTTVKIPTAKKQ